MATSAQVLGKNAIIRFFDGGFYKGFVCATDQGIDKQHEFVETAVSGAGLARTQKPTSYSWSVTGSGIVALEVTNMLSVADLTAFWLAGTRLLMRYERTSENGKTYVDIGYIYIHSISETGSFSGMETFNFVLDGDGLLTQEFIPSPINPPGTMHSFYINVAGANTGATSYSMAPNKEIMGAWPQTDWTVITSGTPAVNQILYNATSGLLSWLIPLEPDQVLHIQYQDL